MDIETKRVQEFSEVLHRKYQAGEFGIDARRNHEQIAPVAQHFAINLIPHRGSVVAEGLSGDHYWLKVNGAEDIVDVTLPLEDEEFVPFYRAYIAGDIGEEELRERAMQTSFESRVVVRRPRTIRYLGKPTLNSALPTGS